MRRVGWFKAACELIHTCQDAVEQFGVKHTMSYRFVPFEPAVSVSNPTGSTTDALAKLVQTQMNDGWEFVSIENHSTIVPGTNGCFGVGTTSPYPKTVSIAVFRK